jgi:hypothetical protein
MGCEPMMAFSVTSRGVPVTATKSSSSRDHEIDPDHVLNHGLTAHDSVCVAGHIKWEIDQIIVKSDCGPELRELPACKSKCFSCKG